MRVRPFAVLLVSVSLVLSLVACGGPSRSSSSPSAAPSRPASPLSKAAFPDAGAIANAADDDDDWFVPGKTLLNNRYTGLAQITPGNAGKLTKAWSTEIADNGQQESGLLI
ncbi:MAG TPA: hypothetical protein VE591_06420, partial [Candidatus Acidoferrum sp.]|nr:hypothetical protein [Candidatus Acidoferrum sp.]